jgi:hypothetical protein
MHVAIPTLLASSAALAWDMDFYLHASLEFFFSPNFLLDLLFLHFIVVSLMNHTNDLVYISP